MTGKCFIALTFAFVGTLSCLSSEVYATVISAKSTSLEDVRSAVNSAKDGDTVRVPEGVSRWGETLDVTKNIILAGAGAEKTVIIDDVRHHSGVEHPEGSERRRSRERTFQKSGQTNQRQKASEAGGSRSALISISLIRNLPFRLTGFTFRGGADTAKAFNGEIRLRGNSHSFRIDHCTFDKLQGTNLTIKGFLWGVIDHCRFNLARQQPMQIGHETWNGGDHGNGSWADDPGWGSEKFVFIEDNVFENSGKRRDIDGYEGARFVVRHNKFRNSGVTDHGTEGQGRGAKQVEEYNNVFVFDIRQAGAQIRSGCIITHDNTWINATKGHVLQAYRQFQYSRHWGIANGENPYDDNVPNGATKGYWETGKHTGADGATVLSDSTKQWTANQWYAPGATFILRNITQEAAAANNRDKLQSFILSNTANTITCSSLTVNSGKNLIFNTGDTYQIWKIAHSLDQPGLGKGKLLTGLPGRPAMWPNQITEPCYSWNNISKDDGTAIDLSSPEPSIKEGRDFFNGTPKPGYKPYIYPHPLAK